MCVRCVKLSDLVLHGEETKQFNVVTKAELLELLTKNSIADMVEKIKSLDDDLLILM